MESRIVDKPKGGRPRHGAEIKNAPLSMRIDPALRTRLQAAAEANRQSLTQEVEGRLAQSFKSRERSILEEGDWNRINEAAHAAGRGTDEELRARVRNSFEGLSVRMSPALAERVAAEAANRRIDVSTEVARRLERSFEYEDEVGGARTKALLQMIGAAIRIAEERMGASWWESYDTFRTTLHTIAGLFQQYMPQRPRRQVSAEQIAAMETQVEASRRLETAEGALTRYLESCNPDVIEPEAAMEGMQLLLAQRQREHEFKTAQARYEELWGNWQDELKDDNAILALMDIEDVELGGWARELESLRAAAEGYAIQKE